MCIKVFCPYQNLQVETTHRKNCSLICAHLVLIVLILIYYLTKNKISTKPELALKRNKMRQNKKLIRTDP
jgi:hypothetical protein